MNTAAALKSMSDGGRCSSPVPSRPANEGLELPDMGGFRPRRVERVVRVDEVSQVVALVRQAIAEGTPLYPISTGRNWGLGSRQPVRDGCILVDLSGLNRIRALDLELGHAIVEPGVTQLDLQAALQGSPFMVNVTGTCAKTSLLGNALDRGVGNHRQRTEDLVGVELVTGRGEQLRVGSFWASAPSVFHYRHGIGPDLLPLFVQSRFGIATAGIIRLIPRPERTVIVDAACVGGRRDQALALLQSWYRHGLISSVWKGYNAAAVRSYALGDGRAVDPDALLIYGMVAGQREMVQRTIDLITAQAAAARCFAELRVHDPAAPSAGLPDVLRVFLSGEAACATHASFPGGCDVDRDSPQGWLMFLPVIPFTPTDLRRARELVKAVGERHGVGLNTTMNYLDYRTVDLVTTLRFQRGTAQAATAHRVLDELHRVFAAAGYQRYRTDIDHQRPEDLYQDPVYIRTLAQLGQVFDPHAILSPGRYTP